MRVAVLDHAFKGNRYRFAFRRTDPGAGEPRTQAAMRSYRIEARQARGDLDFAAGISLLAVGSTWPDAVAQERWTSPPPMPT
jgi:hypothetical protein